MAAPHFEGARTGVGAGGVNRLKRPTRKRIYTSIIFAQLCSEPATVGNLVLASVASIRESLVRRGSCEGRLRDRPRSASVSGTAG